MSIDYGKLFEVANNRGIGMETLNECGFSKSFVAQNISKEEVKQLELNDWFPNS